MIPPVLRRILTGLVMLIIPFALIMTSIRVLLTPLFLQVEYHLPGFPADTYGFNLQDRLKWSAISVEYLVNNQGISFLADQRLPDGSSLYNERELSHMADVKRLVQTMLVVWPILLVALAGLGLWAWQGGWLADFKRGLGFGGWLTIGLIVAILMGVALNFNWLFTEFHRLFFTGNTWIFLYSDTLIRLFPIRFWQDGFILMGVISIGGGLALGLIFGKRS
jgi:integral membrane protein (TIGR01906 family)